MRFLPIYALALLLPNFEGTMRWLLLGLFLAALVWMLEGTRA